MEGDGHAAYAEFLRPPDAAAPLLPPNTTIASTVQVFGAPVRRLQRDVQRTERQIEFEQQQVIAPPRVTVQPLTHTIDDPFAPTHVPRAAPRIIRRYVSPQQRARPMAPVTTTFITQSQNASMPVVVTCTGPMVITPATTYGRQVVIRNVVPTSMQSRQIAALPPTIMTSFGAHQPQQQLSPTANIVAQAFESAQSATEEDILAEFREIDVEALTDENHLLVVDEPQSSTTTSVIDQKPIAQPLTTTAPLQPKQEQIEPTQDERAESPFVDILSESTPTYTDLRPMQPVVQQPTTVPQPVVTMPMYSVIQEQSMPAPVVVQPSPRTRTIVVRAPPQHFAVPTTTTTQRASTPLTIVYKPPPKSTNGPQVQTVTSFMSDGHNRRVYKCTNCQYESTDPAVMSDHAQKCGQLHFGRAHGPHFAMRPREPIVRKGAKKTTKKDRPLTEKVEIQRNKDGLFACDKCPFANRSRLRLQQHAYGHERKDGGVQCPHCSFKQPSVGFMQMHIKLHEKEQKDKQLLFKRRRQAVAKCLKLYSERVQKRRMQQEVKKEVEQGKDICEASADDDEMPQLEAACRNAKHSPSPQPRCLFNDIKPQWCCPYCGKLYVTRAVRTSHIRRRHLKLNKSKRALGRYRCHVCGVHCRTHAARLVHATRAHPPANTFAIMFQEMRRRRIRREAMKENQKFELSSEAGDSVKSDATSRSTSMNSLKMYYAEPISGSRGGMLTEIPPLPPMTAEGGRVLKDVDELMPCKVCPYVAGCPGNLRLHERHHFAPRPEWTEKCMYCSFRCKGIAHIRRHQRCHDDPSLVQRRVQYEQRLAAQGKAPSLPMPELKQLEARLSKTENSPPTLQPMQVTPPTPQRHSNPRRVKCSKCPYRTRFNYDLQQHERHHGDASQPHQCPHCDYGTKSAHHLGKHISLHVHEEIYSSTHSDISATPSPRKLTKVPPSPLARQAMTNAMEDVKQELSQEKVAKRRIFGENGYELPPAKTSKLKLQPLHDSPGEPVYTRANGTSPIGNLHRHGRSITYVCSQCPFRCAKLGILTEHNRLHRGAREFKCALCTFSSKSADKLHEHSEVHRQYSLAKQSQQSPVLKVLSRLSQEQLEDQVRASSTTPAEKSDLNRLVRKLVKRNNEEVLEPAKRSPSKAQRKQSQRQSVDGKTVCPHCPFTSGEMATLSAHMLHHAHTGRPLPFLCPHCSYSTAVNTELRTHIALHMRATHNRPVAQKRRRTASATMNVALRRNLRHVAMPGDSIPRLPCRHTDCPFNCTSVNRLIEHQRQYHDSRATWATVPRAQKSTPAEKHTQRVTRRMSRLLKECDNRPNDANDDNVDVDVVNIKDASVIGRIADALRTVAREEHNENEEDDVSQRQSTHMSLLAPSAGLQSPQQRHANSTQQDVYKCTRCMFQCSIRTLYSQHISLHNIDRSLPPAFCCNMCDYGCDNEEVVTFHKRYHHTDTSLNELTTSL